MYNVHEVFLQNGPQVAWQSINMSINIAWQQTSIFEIFTPIKTNAHEKTKIANINTISGESSKV